MKYVLVASLVITAFCYAGPRGQAPEFTQTDPAKWLNSPPLKMADLRGKVVLIDVWTFACWNCYRSFPWLNDFEKRYEKKGLQVIGIHSPEFAREKVKANVERHIKKYGLKHPVMIDNDFAYWKALGNRYWPAFYVIDTKGRVQGVFVGETHKGDGQARKIESLVKRLLPEQKE